MKETLEANVLKRLEAGLPVTRSQCIRLHSCAAARKLRHGKLDTVGFHIRGVFRELFRFRRNR